ncbi:MAG: 30S ribosomal protein S20 [Chloroflexota bacterium]|nr:30S ribosomal protein S20 [Chloroflexota bacterium]
MPSSKQKAAKVSERRRIRNKSVRSGMRTAVGKAEVAISSRDGDESQDAVKNAVSSLDRAATKGVIHRNNAARRKSRLMKKLNSSLSG